jgi:hypothetical protein
MVADNLKLRIVRRLLSPLDKFYFSRQPGPMMRRIIGAAGPLLRVVPANDKWSLVVHAAQWMRVTEEPPLQPLLPTKRVFIFTTFRGEFTLDLSYAALLAWRGHQVTIGYLPHLQSPIKPPFSRHPNTAPYLASVFAEVATASKGRVIGIDLSKLPPGANPDPAFVERQSHSDAVMRLGRETIDPSNASDAAVLAHYADRGIAAFRQAETYFKTNMVDVAIIPNGMSFDGAYVLDAAKQAGVAVTTLEKFAFRHHRVVTHGDSIFTFRDLDLLWERRFDLGYEFEPQRSNALAKARRILTERRKASTTNWAWKYQFAPDQSDEEALRVAGIDPNKPFALVCTNVPYDAGYYQFTRMFKSMKDWLQQSVRYLLNHTEITVVVRVHPGEALHYGGTESSVGILAEFAEHPRLVVIGPKEKVNTYPLMAACRAGVVFSSTTGVEMAMLGRPVVVASDVYYAGKGFTRDCADIDGYFLNLMQATLADADSAEQKRVSDAAAMFYYILHFVQQHPYPYDKASDLLNNPPHKMVGTPAGRQVARLMDILTMSSAEYANSLPSLYGLEVTETRS